MNLATLRHWFDAHVLRVDAEKLRPLPRLGVFVARMVWAVGLDVIRGHLTLRAMSLVYTTLLSLVPLLAVSFSVLKAFGVHNQVEPTLAGFLAPLGPQSTEITDRVVEFVENMEVGVLGSVGLALLFYTVVALLQKIEQAFNATWRIRRDRALAERFSDYLSVLLIGPVLVFSSLGITASVFGSETVRALAATPGLGMLVNFTAALVPYVLIITAFTLVYVFVPNTRVRAVSALVGALVAGVLWQTSGWVFASFVVGSTQYTAVYSAFATLILFMIWLYVSWLILLVGASVAYYHQHPRRLLVLDGELRLSPRMLERTGLAAMTLAASHFYHRRRPVSAEDLANRLQLPVDAVDEAIAALVAAGLLRQISGGEEPAYQPATPPDNTTIGEILVALRAAGEGAANDAAQMHLPDAVQTLAARLDEAALRTLEGQTLRDLIQLPEAISGPTGAADPSDRISRAAPSR